MNPKYQIFISSTFQDLKEQRDAVIKAILEMGHIPVGMEAFGAANEDSWKLIERTIKDSDYYIVIVARRYGSIHQASGISWTEREFDFAIENEIPCLAFVLDREVSWPPSKSDDSDGIKALMKAFQKKIGTHRNMAYWKNTDELSLKVTLSLNKTFALYPQPGWVKSSGDSQVVSEEIARLSRENAELKKQVQDSFKQKNYDTEIKILSDNKIKLQIEGDDTEVSSKSVPLIVFSSSILHYFTHWHTEVSIHDFLTETLNKMKEQNVVRGNFILPNTAAKQFYTVMLLLDILEAGNIQKEYHGVPVTESAFRLTIKGKEFVSEAIAGNIDVNKYLPQDEAT